MNKAQLRSCPECRQSWPTGVEHDLRGFGWLAELPRHVSPTNIDCVIHDGAHGRDRFLAFETKRDGEPLLAGQEWVLRGLAASGWYVAVLRGTTERLSIAPVLSAGIGDYMPTRIQFVRDAVVRFLEGSAFRVAPQPRPTRTCPSCHQDHPVGTTCGARSVVAA